MKLQGGETKSLAGWLGNGYTSMEAEALAIVAGLASLSADPGFAAAGRIAIITDCKGVLEALTNTARAGQRNKALRPRIRDSLTSWMRGLGDQVDLRWQGRKATSEQRAAHHLANAVRVCHDLGIEFSDVQAKAVVLDLPVPAGAAGT